MILLIQKSFNLSPELKKLQGNLTTAKPSNCCAVEHVRVFGFYFWQFMKLTMVKSTRGSAVQHGAKSLTTHHRVKDVPQRACWRTMQRVTVAFNTFHPPKLCDVYWGSQGLGGSWSANYCLPRPQQPSWLLPPHALLKRNSVTELVCHGLSKPLHFHVWE